MKWQLFVQIIHSDRASEIRCPLSTKDGMNIQIVFEISNIQTFIRYLIQYS